MARAARVVVQQFMAASPERVYDTLLDPKKAAQFLFATADGRMVVAEIDRRVGGKFTFVDQRGGVDVLHTGKYLELDRPRTVAFTFSVPQFSEVETVVSIDIAGEDKGCVVTLTHDGVLPEWAARTKAGWVGILKGLETVAKVQVK